MDFVVVPVSVFPPGRCVGCHSSQGPLVDTLVEELVPTGRVYVCERCVGEMARLFGWSDPEAAALRDGELRAVREQVEEMRHVVDRVARVAKVSLEDARVLARSGAFEEE